MTDTFGSDAASVRYPKNHKFAEQLAGRFFVSGVSGRFRKTRRRGADEEERAIADMIHAHETKTSNRLRKEEQIRQDARRIQELQNKLEEIHRNKTMRKERDLQRQMKKAEYLATILIQCAFRRYLRRKEASAVAADVIVNFLKAITAKQAIMAASWATAVLVRFVNRAKLRFIGALIFREMRAIRREEEEDEAAALALQEVEEEDQMKRLENIPVLRNRTESDCESEEEMECHNTSEGTNGRDDDNSDGGNSLNSNDGESRDDSDVGSELDGRMSLIDGEFQSSSPASRSTNSDSSLADTSLNFDLSISASVSTGTSLSGSVTRRTASCLDSGRSDLTAEGGDRASRGPVTVTGLINASRLRAIKREKKLIREEQERVRIAKKEEKVRVKKVQTKQAHSLLEKDRDREREQRLQAIDELRVQSEQNTQAEALALSEASIAKQRAKEEFFHAVKKQSIRTAREKAKLRTVRDRREEEKAQERARELVETRGMHREDLRVMQLLSRRGSLHTKYFKLSDASNASKATKEKNRDKERDRSRDREGEKEKEKGNRRGNGRGADEVTEKDRGICGDTEGDNDGDTASSTVELVCVTTATPLVGDEVERAKKVKLTAAVVAQRNAMRIRLEVRRKLKEKEEAELLIEKRKELQAQIALAAQGALLKRRPTISVASNSTTIAHSSQPLTQHQPNTLSARSRNSKDEEIDVNINIVQKASIPLQKRKKIVKKTESTVTSLCDAEWNGPPLPPANIIADQTPSPPSALRYSSPSHSNLVTPTSSRSESNSTGTSRATPSLSPTPPISLSLSLPPPSSTPRKTSPTLAAATTVTPTSTSSSCSAPSTALSLVTDNRRISIAPSSSAPNTTRTSSLSSTHASSRTGTIRTSEIPTKLGVVDALSVGHVSKDREGGKFSDNLRGVRARTRVDSVSAVKEKAAKGTRNRTGPRSTGEKTMNSRDTANGIDSDEEDFNKSRHGKVASLLAIVSRARRKMNATPPNDIAGDDSRITVITHSSSSNSTRSDHQQSKTSMTDKSKPRQTDSPREEHTDGHQLWSGSGLNGTGLLERDLGPDGRNQTNAVTCDADNGLLVCVQSSSEMAHTTIPFPVIVDEERIGTEFNECSSIDGVVNKTSVTDIVKEALPPTTTSTSTTASPAVTPQLAPLPVASSGMTTLTALSLRPPPSLSFDGGFSISISRKPSLRDSFLTHKDKASHRISGNAKSVEGDTMPRKASIQRKNVASSSALTGDAMHSNATLLGSRPSSQTVTTNNSNVHGIRSKVHAKKKTITAASGSAVRSPTKLKNKIGSKIIGKDINEVEVEVEEALEEEYRMLRMRLESNVYDAVAERRKEFQLRENERKESSLKRIEEDRDVKGRGSETDESIQFKNSAAAGRIGIAVQGGGTGQGAIRQGNGQTQNIRKENRHGYGNGQKDDRLLDDIEKMSAGDILSYFQTQDDLDGDDDDDEEEEEEEECNDMQEGESGEEEEEEGEEEEGEDEEEEEEEEGDSEVEDGACDSDGRDGEVQAESIISLNQNERRDVESQRRIRELEKGRNAVKGTLPQAVDKSYRHCEINDVSDSCLSSSSGQGGGQAVDRSRGISENHEFDGSEKDSDDEEDEEQEEEEENGYGEEEEEEEAEEEEGEGEEEGDDEKEDEEGEEEVGNHDDEGEDEDDDDDDEEGEENDEEVRGEEKKRGRRIVAEEDTANYR